MRNYKLFFSLSILAFLLFSSPALAQEGISDNEVNDLAKGLYCPVCENVPLDVCPTQACIDWRELIRTKLAQGESRQEIYDYFARQYGDGVLAEPPRSGLNLLVWLFPIIAVVAGGLYFGLTMRGLKVGEAGETAVPPTPAPSNSQPIAEKRPLTDYITQIEQELEQS